MLIPFDFAPRTRLVFAPGSIDRLGKLVREYGGHRVLLVTDPGIVQAGHAERAQKILEAVGLVVSVFDRVIENPTTGTVAECVDAAGAARVDSLVGLGGGSSIDTARGCNFLLSCGGKMEDYWGVGKATRPMLPLVAVPTTAGTGSECQSFALIAQERTHTKMACGDPEAAAKVAILDPELTLTQPPSVTATTGMDALSHAVETAVTTKRTALSQMLSRQAFRLCVRGLHVVLADPHDVDGRGHVLLGAALAGLAIENSMLGAAHAAANPLTAHYGLVHGQAVGLMLPAVVRYNSELAEPRIIYQHLAVAAGLVADGGDRDSGPELLAEYLERYLAAANLPVSLADVNVPAADLDRLAREAAGQWTGQFNPRPMDNRSFRELYRSAVRTP
jgi:alcohol dehydrogenase